MRFYFFMLLLFVFSAGWAQVLKKRQGRRLESLGINLGTLDIRNPQISGNISDILDQDRRYRVYNIISIASIPLAVTPLLFGAWILGLSSGNPDPSGNPNPVGISVIAVGVALVGVSIPAFIWSKKRADERGMLIRRYRDR